MIPMVSNKGFAALLLVASAATPAAWVSFSLDRIGAPLAAGQHTDILNLNPFSIPQINLYGSPRPAEYSFTNSTGLELHDFHMTLSCVLTSPLVFPNDNQCNAGAHFGPTPVSSDIFATAVENRQFLAGEGPFGTYVWRFDFAGGAIANGDSFAIYDQTRLAPGATFSTYFGVTANASVPDPSSWALVCTVLAGLGLAGRKTLRQSLRGKA